VIPHTKYTGWRENDFNVHGYSKVVKDPACAYTGNVVPNERLGIPPIHMNDGPQVRKRCHVGLRYIQYHDTYSPHTFC
jgi:hypothetical protein